MTNVFWNGVSLASTVNSKAFSLLDLDNVGITLNTSAVTTNTGTFTVEGTNDNPYNMDGSTKTSGVVWFNIPVSPTMVLANANATFEPDLNQVPWAYLRVKFVPAGGTPNGTVVGTICGKGI